jgi:hypothetical protein
MDIHELRSIGYATSTELKPFTKNTCSMGKNEWGFEERYIVDTYGGVWDWIPEDRIYEYNPDKRVMYC